MENIGAEGLFDTYSMLMIQTQKEILQLIFLFCVSMLEYARSGITSKMVLVRATNIITMKDFLSW